MRPLSAITAVKRPYFAVTLLLTCCLSLCVSGSAVAVDPPPASPPSPPAEDWATNYLENDPLANDEQITLEELRAGLADEARRDTLIPRHLVRATLTVEEQRQLLTEALANPSMTVRRQAAEELQLQGWLGEVVSKILLQLAERNDQESRFAAVLALHYVELPPEQAPDHYWNALLEALASDDPQVRAAAQAQFERWGVAAVPFLLDAVQNGEPRLRRPAAATLAELLANLTVHTRESSAHVPGPVEAAEPPEPAPTTDEPATDPPTKGRPSDQSGPQTTRERDEAHPNEVRVYYGTNREIVEVTPDLSSRLWGLPFVLLAAGAAIYWRLRKRGPDATPRGRWATSFIVLLASGVAIWSVSAWNDALRRHYSEHVGATFGPRRNAEGKIQYGYCDVSLPPTHSVGHVEEPLFGPEDEDQHVVLRRTERLEDEAFFQAVRTVLDRRPRDQRDCFVFVHGYNSTFEQAARRTAQIHYDLKFPGAPLFYSWPSRGSIQGYPWDRNEIQYSYRYVKKFLLELTDKLEADRIHVIAHSMGADAVGRAIAELGDRGRVDA